MKRIYSRAVYSLAFVSALLVGSSPAHATVITYTELDITGPVLGFGDSGDAFSSGSFGNYTFSGEFCVDQFCSNPGGGGGNDSLLRLTNLSLLCTLQAGTCSSVDVAFQAIGGFGLGRANLSITLNGTGSANGFVRICIQDSASICDQNLNGAKSFSFPFSGGPSGSASGTVNVASGYNVFGIFHVDGVAAGQSVDLGSSLDIGFIGLTPVAVPEPATAGLLLFGCGLLWTLRRRIP